MHPSSVYIFLFIFLRTELSKNMQHDYDTHKAQGSDQDIGGRDLKTWRIVRVELQNVVAGTLGASAATASGSGTGSSCSTSLSGLKKKQQQQQKEKMRMNE
jgi:hypothetical protein